MIYYRKRTISGKTIWLTPRMEDILVSIDTGDVEVVEELSDGSRRLSRMGCAELCEGLRAALRDELSLFSAKIIGRLPPAD